MKSGRNAESQSAYARTLGITYEQLKRLGGMERLKRMSPDARILILKPLGNGKSKQINKGGLRKWGYRVMRRGLDHGPLAEGGTHG